VYRMLSPHLIALTWRSLYVVNQAANYSGTVTVYALGKEAPLRTIAKVSIFRSL
jgi:hypothetical protein